MLEISHQSSSISHQASGKKKVRVRRCQVTDSHQSSSIIKHQSSGKKKVRVRRCQVTDQASSIKNEVRVVRNQSSVISHQPSVISHQVKVRRCHTTADIDMRPAVTSSQAPAVNSSHYRPKQHTPPSDHGISPHTTTSQPQQHSTH